MKRDKLIEDLINLQFEIAGHDITYAELMDKNEEEKNRKDPWYQRYTITKDQEDLFTKKGKVLISKTISKHSVDKEWPWFHLMYGLKVV